jgi:hypothetical protein
MWENAVFVTKIDIEILTNLHVLSPVNLFIFMEIKIRKFVLFGVPSSCLHALMCRLCFAACFMLDSCLAYSSTLKMKETCSSETSVDFQQTTRRYIPEDRTLQYSSWVEVSNYAYISFFK